MLRAPGADLQPAEGRLGGALAVYCCGVIVVVLRYCGVAVRCLAGREGCVGVRSTDFRRHVHTHVCVCLCTYAATPRMNNNNHHFKKTQQTKTKTKTNTKINQCKKSSTYSVAAQEGLDQMKKFLLPSTSVSASDISAACIFGFCVLGGFACVCGRVMVWRTYIYYVCIAGHVLR